MHNKLLSIDVDTKVNYIKYLAVTEYTTIVCNINQIKYR